MSDKISIYQIYYKPEQRVQVDPAFIAYDNTSNTDPQLREYPIFLQGYDVACKNKDDYWGFLSLKFSQKTGVTGEKFKQFIERNPGYDCYFINPCVVMDTLFENVWTHGEMWHPGLTNLTNSIFEKSVGYNTLKVDRYKMDYNSFAFCNYFVGNKYFWDTYLAFIKAFLNAAETDPQLKQKLYGGNAQYNLDHSLSFYPFIIERLFSTFLCHYDFMTVCPYKYSYEEQSHKMQEIVFKELEAIRNVKWSAVSGGHYSLFSSWQLLSQLFHARNPQLFLTE
jgi:hypothetical protein